ncbi:CLUMA_CG016078, isoform A [Clunio marinus]|uniref:CLUMA_CG016078, isoform A n=1 Tax=Clunio marinus TaxID=568069 RepID=A0A1J1ISR5_9DIPT|nr:CLUMA_CG016078, isoform A [Clunio marinus]
MIIHSHSSCNPMNKKIQNEKKENNSISSKMLTEDLQKFLSTYLLHKRQKDVYPYGNLLFKHHIREKEIQSKLKNKSMD